MSEASPLRLLVDLRALAPPVTGVGRYTLELLRVWVTDPRVDLVALAPGPAREVLAAEGLAVRVVPVRFASHQHPFFELEAQLSVAGKIRALSLDLAWGPAYFLPPLPAGLPGVVTVHDTFCYDQPETMSARFAWLLRRQVRAAAARAAALVVPSRVVAERVTTLHPRAGDRVRVVREGVGPAFFQVGDEAAARVRKRLDLPEDFLLAVGGAHPRKGLERTLRALKRLEDPPLLVVAGTPPPAARPGVRALGYVDHDQLPGLYRAARALVFPSPGEGFGLPPLEALASGTAVVATAVGALPELVAEAAQLLEVEAGDDALATALAATRPPSREDRARRRGAVRALTWEAAAEDHLGVFEGVTRRAERGGRPGARV